MPQLTFTAIFSYLLVFGFFAVAAEPKLLFSQRLGQVHSSICRNIETLARNKNGLKFSLAQTRTKTTENVKAMKFSLNKANEAATKVVA